MVQEDEEEELYLYGSTPSTHRQSRARTKNYRYQCIAASSSVALLVGVVLCMMAIQNKEDIQDHWQSPTSQHLPLHVAHDMDKDMNPCNDFYDFTCASWQRRVKLPKDATEWTRSWDPVIDKNRKVLQKLIEKDQGMVGTYYKSCMDTSLIDSLGVKPLENFLNAVELIAEPEQLIHILASFHTMNVPCLFDWEIVADPKDPQHYALNLIQGGLTLPDAGYYISDDEETRKIRGEYLEVIYNVMRLTGLSEDDSREQAGRVMDVETELAHMFGSPEKERKKVPHHRFSIDSLNALAPTLQFPVFFQIMTRNADIGVNRDNILVLDVEYFQQLEMFFKSANLNQLKPYLRFRLAYLMGSDLSDDFLMQGLRLSQILMGVKVTLPRWKKCMESTNAALSDAVGKLYIDYVLSPSARSAALEMLENLRLTFQSDLKSTEWMEPKTRNAALAKLNTMLFEVGYPSRWTHYPFLVAEHSFFENVVAARVFAAKSQLMLLNSHVDRRKWGQIKVTDVNAFYVREVNTLFVPAGILQKPFFSLGYAASRNYGSLGCIMGHEMTHGFDDVGRLYGPSLGLAPWWAPEDVQEFTQRSQCVASFYQQFSPKDSPVSGSFTLGEDIADMGGVKLAYLAFEAVTRRKEVEVSADDAQLFFISWGQTWCSVVRHKTSELQARTDEHAPDKERVNAPLALFPPFADTFKCPLGSVMSPAHRCELW